jgi:hypothetical protein
MYREDSKPRTDAALRLIVAPQKMPPQTFLEHTIYTSYW